MASPLFFFLANTHKITYTYKSMYFTVFSYLTANLSAAKIYLMEA